MNDEQPFPDHAPLAIDTHSEGLRELAGILRTRIETCELAVKSLPTLRAELVRIEKALRYLSPEPKRVRAAKGEAASVVRLAFASIAPMGSTPSYEKLLAQSQLDCRGLDRPPSLSALRREVRKALAAPTVAAPR